MHFKVDRSKWVRGGMGGDAAMLNNEGNMSCLGHCALQLGWKPEDLAHRPLPANVVRDANRPFRELGLFVMKAAGKWIETEFAYQAARINDAYTISDRTREARLRALFKKHGHTISFHDGDAENGEKR